MSYQSTNFQTDIEDIRVALSHRGIVRARTVLDWHRIEAAAELAVEQQELFLGDAPYLCLCLAIATSK